MTTVIRVYVVSIGDDITEEVGGAINAFHVDRARALRRSGRTYRSPRGWTRWAGVIEIDLIHPQLARIMSPTKVGLLRELGVDVETLRPEQRVVVLHEHAVVDHRGHETAEAMKRDIRIVWPGTRRVHGKALHEEGTVAENLKRLADYSTKRKMRYGIAWDGRKTRYLSNYEIEWRDYVQKIYDHIGIDGLLNSNIISQADHHRMHTNGSAPRAKSKNQTAVQLMIEVQAKKVSLIDTKSGPDTPGKARRVNVSVPLDGGTQALFTETLGGDERHMVGRLPKTSRTPDVLNELNDDHFGKRLQLPPSILDTDLYSCRMFAARFARGQEKEQKSMKIREIIRRYIDPSVISAEALQDMEDALARMGPGLAPHELPLMYGDPEGDLRLEKQRLDIAKTRAEITRIEAAAARDRAEAARSARR